MSVLTVTTRILPLDSGENYEFPPLDDVAEGVTRKVEVSFVTDQSGKNFRIERIEEERRVGPGETTESVNEAFAEKLRSTGFKKLEDDIPLNEHDKSLQISVPTSISRKDGITSNENLVNVSLVKHSDLEKDLPASKKFQMLNKSKVSNDAKSSNYLLNSQYPSYMMKKCKNKSNLKYKFNACDSRKFTNSKYTEKTCSSVIKSGKTCASLPCSMYNDKDLNIGMEFQDQKLLKHNSFSNHDVRMKNNAKKTATVVKETLNDSLYSADLLLNEQEPIDSSSDSLQIDLSKIISDKSCFGSIIDLDKSLPIKVDNNASDLSPLIDEDLCVNQFDSTNVRK